MYTCDYLYVILSLKETFIEIKKTKQKKRINNEMGVNVCDDMRWEWMRVGGIKRIHKYKPSGI